MTRCLRWQLILSIVLIGAGLAAAEDPSTPRPLKKIAPVPIYRLPLENQRENLSPVPPNPSAAPSSGSPLVAFHAITDPEWLEGLIPVFAVEKSGRFELRRRPPTGLENLTEPLFWALPPEGEPETVRYAGRWRCSATHADGAKDVFGWELTVETNQVAGRFDPHTDYRFAYVTGGTVQSNRITLTAEYIRNRYELTGEWRDGLLTGTWQQTQEDTADHGTWEARRDVVSSKLEDHGFKTVPLYEWREAAGTGRRYDIDSTRQEAGWERSERPIARVWRNVER